MTYIERHWYPSPIPRYMTFIVTDLGGTLIATAETTDIEVTYTEDSLYYCKEYKSHCLLFFMFYDTRRSRSLVLLLALFSVLVLNRDVH